jgi:hypothetical protein
MHRWLLGEEDTQKTDVHYRSLTGEGNFNWRFIFRFKYHPYEDKMVVTTKKSLIPGRVHEQKVPCRLYLQVWDNDLIRNDFLGKTKHYSVYVSCVFQRVQF